MRCRRDQDQDVDSSVTLGLLGCCWSGHWRRWSVARGIDEQTDDGYVAAALIPLSPVCTKHGFSVYSSVQNVPDLGRRFKLKSCLVYIGGLNNRVAGFSDRVAEEAL